MSCHFLLLALELQLFFFLSIIAVLVVEFQYRRYQIRFIFAVKWTGLKGTFISKAVHGKSRKIMKFGLSIANLVNLI